MKADETILADIYAIIESRKTASIDASYTARLFSKGLHKIAQKFGEEAVEAAIAAVSESDQRLIRESADVLYHLLVVWSAKGIVPSAVWEELSRRFGAPDAPKELRKNK